MARGSAGPGDRRPQDRLDDHAAIDHLADDLLPALVAKLGANGLGELEVREGAWRVRLRMPADGPAAGPRRSPGARQGRGTDGQRGEHQRSEPSAPAESGVAAAAPAPSPAGAASVGASRLIATSPAVGYFRPRTALRAGARVRAGDSIGSVDVLGIGQDVVAPGDGLIGATLVGPGEPVEYGQGIIVLEQLGEPRAQGTGAGAGPAAADAVEGGGVGIGVIDGPSGSTPALVAASDLEAAPGDREGRGETAGPPPAGTA